MTDVTLATHEGPEITPESVGTTITVAVGSLATGGGGGGGGAVDSVNGETGVVVLDATDVGADATGTAAAAVAAHVAAGDPHPGYLTPAEGAAAYDALGSAATAITTAAADATSKVAAHEADTASVHGIADTSALATTAAVAAGYQPLDSDLTAIAALTTTSYGRAVLELANQAALMGLLSASSETASGIIELATQAEVTTGTDDARAVTPLKLATRLAAYAQPLDSDLTSIAALTTTTYGRAFLTLANNAATFAVLGTGTPSSTTYLRGDGTWSTPAGGSGSVATDTIFDAKGDLAVGTGADTAAKLTVGTNGQLLVADSAEATGLKYAGETSWTAPTLGASWVNFGSPYDNAGYRKDAEGRVWMRGLIKDGTSAATIFTLPAGYRPTGKITRLTWGIALTGSPVLEITTAGVVTITRTTSGYYSLDCWFWTT